jgi:photosystem II stability/assembly factor-like uncharacterized protein
LYAGTPFGLYRSIDDGVTWTVMGLAGDAIDSIYVDGAGQVVYAGTERRGVQRSRDGGLTWSGLGNVRLPVEGLVFSDDRKVLYVSTDGGGVARIGFFKELSKDGGATMDTDPPAASGPFGGTVIDLELDPITPTTLYAATNVGLFKSIDNGDSWQVTGLDSRPVFSVAVDPVNPNAVYAGTAGDGVLRSGDGGLTWTAAGDGPIQGKVLYDLAVDPSNSQTIYAAGRAAHLDGTTSGDWGGGVFKSLDGGTTWGQMNEGLPEGWVYALAVDPLQPSTLYAGTHSMGVFKSLDGGMTWAPKNDGLVTTNHPSPDNLRIRSIAIDPRNPQNLTIGVWGGSGVFESDSAAETWRLAGRGGLRARVRSVAYNPVTPGVVYAGMAEGGARFTQHLPDDDRWHPFPDQPGGGWNDFSIVSAIAVHPADGRTVFLGVYGAGVLRTTDGGQTWQAVNEGLAASSVTALVSLPTHPATLYAATRGSGIFESTDGGAHWSPHAWAGPLDWAVDLAIDPSDPQTLYVATEANGLLPLDLRSGAFLTTPQAPTDTPGLVPPATATSLP